MLIDNIPSPNGNHNAGDLHFGKDGYLYVTVGDGGCDYAGGGCAGTNDAARDQQRPAREDPAHHPRRRHSRRTTPSRAPARRAAPRRAARPPGKSCQETFAWGLRNPFRFAFDPNAAGTRFFINDVGQNIWEEIDEGVAGADYGWNVREGPCANGSTTNCGPPPRGHDEPDLRLRPQLDGLRVDHRRRVRAERRSGRPSTTARTCSPTTSAARSSGSIRARRAATRARTFATRARRLERRPPGVRPRAGGPGALLHDLRQRRPGAADLAHRRQLATAAAATAAPTSGPAPLAVSFDGSGSTDPERRLADVPLGLRRRRDGADDDSDDEPHATRRPARCTASLARSRPARR